MRSTRRNIINAEYEEIEDQKQNIDDPLMQGKCKMDCKGLCSNTIPLRYIFVFLCIQFVFYVVVVTACILLIHFNVSSKSELEFFLDIAICVGLLIINGVIFIFYTMITSCAVSCCGVCIDDVRRENLAMRRRLHTLSGSEKRAMQIAETQKVAKEQFRADLLHTREKFEEIQADAKKEERRLNSELQKAKKAEGELDSTRQALLEERSERRFVTKKSVEMAVKLGRMCEIGKAYNKQLTFEKEQSAKLKDVILSGVREFDRIEMLVEEKLPQKHFKKYKKAVDEIHRVNKEVAVANIKEGGDGGSLNEIRSLMADMDWKMPALEGGERFEELPGE